LTWRAVRSATSEVEAELPVHEDNVIVRLWICLDMLETRRLRAECKHLQPQAVQERRRRGGEDLVNRGNNRLAQHRRVDWSELDKKAVDPF